MHDVACAIYQYSSCTFGVKFAHMEGINNVLGIGSTTSKNVRLVVAINAFPIELFLIKIQPNLPGLLISLCFFLYSIFLISFLRASLFS